MMEELQRHCAAILEQAGGTWGLWVENLATGDTWSLHEHERFYAASLIKVPIMAAVFAEASRGRITLSEPVRLRPEDKVGGAGVLQHLSDGLSITVADLVTLMIIQSDNTATNMLIDLVGTDAIRGAMQKAGMENSRFFNKLMIVPAELEGYNEVTAADMASLFRKLAAGGLVSWHASSRMLAILKQQQIRDGLPRYLPDPASGIVGGPPLWEMAHKTGSVTGIEHDAGILYAGRTPVLIVALSRGAESMAAKDAMGKIARFVYDRCR